MWDASYIAAVTAAIVTPLVGLLTFAATKGVDAWLKLRKDKREGQQLDRKANMEERTYEDTKASEATKELVDELKRRLTDVEGSLKSCHDQHLEGVRSIGVLTGKIEVLTTINSQLGLKLSDLEKEVDRLTRHEQANLEQAKEIAVAKIQEQATQGGKTP